MDDNKFKHQFEAKNDYNAAVAPGKSLYPQPPMEPATVLGRGSLT